MNLVLRNLVSSLIRSAVLFAALTATSELSAQSNPAPAAATQTSQQMLAGVTARAPDAFYDLPAQVPNRPGALLRSELLTDVTLPPGLRGWRILYTTTVDDSTPATAVATVFAPVKAAEGPRPVIAWAHATTGLVQRCMPSLVSKPTLGIPALDWIVTAGWVVVATDYPFAENAGPHPYLIGEGEARAELDSVRAARQMPELTLGARTVVWGHSQGGHTALWTGIIGPRYAPDVEIAGIAAIAPVADVAKLMAMNPRLDKRLGPYVAAAYSRFYSDVTFEQAVRPEAFKAAREVANLCGFLPPEDPKRIGALMASFEGLTLAAGSNTPVAARLVQNAADRPIAAPVVIAQGSTDVVVPQAATDAYVGERCAAGQRIEYWKLAGRDHAGIVQPGPLDEPLVAWTLSRFAGGPLEKGCASKSF